MARTVPIDGDPTLTVKRRNPWGVLGLTLITLGIYAVVWWYKINNEMVRVGRARQRPDLGTSAGTSLVAYLAGGFVVIPTIVTFVTTSRRIQRTEEVLGAEGRLSGWLLAGITLVTLGLGASVYQQHHLNKAWDALERAATTPSGLPPSGMPAAAAQAYAPPAPPPPPPPSSPSSAPNPFGEKPSSNPFGDNG